MKKYIDMIMAIAAVLLLFFVTGFLGYTIYSDIQREEARVREIADAGVVKVVNVDYDNETVVVETPKGNRKVRAKFAGKAPNPGETWKISLDHSFLKFLSRQ